MHEQCVPGPLSFWEGPGYEAEVQHPLLCTNVNHTMYILGTKMPFANKFCSKRGGGHTFKVGVFSHDYSTARMLL